MPSFNLKTPMSALAPRTATSRATSVALAAVFIAAHLVFLTYIVKIETLPECECARHPYLSLVKVWSIFVVCFTALTTFGFLSGDYLPAGLQPYLGALGMVVAVASIVVYALALRWVSVQVKIGCSCSADIRRDILRWWSAIFLSAVVLMTLTPFLLVVTTSIGGPFGAAARTVATAATAAPATVARTIGSRTTRAVAAVNRVARNMASVRQRAARAPKRA